MTRWTRAIPVLPALDLAATLRQFGINDPDKNLLVFAQRL